MPSRFAASAKRRYVSTLAITTRASTLSSSMPTSDTRAKTSITTPLSRIVVTTSASVLCCSRSTAPPAPGVGWTDMCLTSSFPARARAFGLGEVAVPGLGLRLFLLGLVEVAVAGFGLPFLILLGLGGGLPCHGPFRILLLLVTACLVLILGAALCVDLAVPHMSAPSAGLLLAHLDERLEAHEVLLQGTPRYPEAGSRLLEQPLRLEVDTDFDSRQAVAQAVEGDHAGYLGPAQALPGDPLVRPLLGDLDLPLARRAQDRSLPEEVGVVTLLDLLDPAHELRELLELSELVVGRLEGDGDVHGLLQR